MLAGTGTAVHRDSQPLLSPFPHGALTCGASLAGVSQWVWSSLRAPRRLLWHQGGGGSAALGCWGSPPPHRGT